MISRKLISALLATLSILIVACAVLLGFQLLLSALQDSAAAATLGAVSLGCVILLVVDVLLLVGALAIRVLEQDQNGEDSP